MKDMFYVTGSDGETVLYSDTSSNACVMWAEQYVRWGCWGGWGFLLLWEVAEGHEDDVRVSTFCRDNGDEPQRWEDEQ